MKRGYPEGVMLTMLAIVGRYGLIALAAEQYCKPTSALNFFAIVGFVLLSEDMPRLAAAIERFIYE